MSQLVIHPLTQQQLDQFVERPSHALLLVGPRGIGKGSLATQLTTRILDIADKTLANQPYVLRITPDKQNISIETMRDAQRFLQRKTIGQRPTRRIIIIEDAQAMGQEAQNAFLKSLEEPPMDTVIILTAIKPELLLPTITSRTRNLTVHVPAREAVEQAFGNSPIFARAYSLSGGLPGLLTALLQDDEAHPLYEAVNQAKSLMQTSHFDRLASIESIRSKEQAQNLLEALARIAQAGLEQAAAKQQAAALKRWQQWLAATYDTQVALETNANLKLALTNLFLQA